MDLARIRVGSGPNVYGLSDETMTRIREQAKREVAARVKERRLAEARAMDAEAVRAGRVLSDAEFERAMCDELARCEEEEVETVDANR